MRTGIRARERYLAPYFSTLSEMVDGTTRTAGYVGEYYKVSNVFDY